MDKSIVKASFSLLGKYIVCITMSFIVTMSLFMVFTATSQTGDTVEGAAYVIMMVICQICALGTLALFINGNAYYIGDSDSNKVQFGRMKYDKLKGLKLGIVPAVFALISYIVLILGKLGIVGDIALVIFRFANYHLVGYNQLIFGNESNAAELSWMSIAAALLCVIIVPLISHICYTLGYKRINLFERLVFKKK